MNVKVELDKMSGLPGLRVLDQVAQRRRLRQELLQPTEQGVLDAEISHIDAAEYLKVLNYFDIIQSKLSNVFICIKK